MNFPLTTDCESRIMKKVQVKLTESRVGNLGFQPKGSTVTVSEHEAARMYAGGQCEALDGKPIEHTEVTQAEVDAAEAAKRPKKGGKKSRDEGAAESGEDADGSAEEKKPAAKAEEKKPVAKK